MSTDLVHKFLNEIDEQILAEEVKLALKIQLYTGLRIGEILSIEWDEKVCLSFSQQPIYTTRILPRKRIRKRDRRFS